MHTLALQPTGVMVVAMVRLCDNYASIILGIIGAESSKNSVWLATSCMKINF